MLQKCHNKAFSHLNQDANNDQDDSETEDGKEELSKLETKNICNNGHNVLLLNLDYTNHNNAIKWHQYIANYVSSNYSSVIDSPPEIA